MVDSERSLGPGRRWRSRRAIGGPNFSRCRALVRPAVPQRLDVAPGKAEIEPDRILDYWIISGGKRWRREQSGAMPTSYLIRRSLPPRFRANARKSVRFQRGVAGAASGVAGPEPVAPGGALDAGGAS